MLKLQLIFIIILSSFFLQATDLPKVNLNSPRASFKTFLKAMVHVKQKDSTNEAYALALKTLSLDHFNPLTRDVSGRQIANQLVDILDRTEKINYKDIPENFDGLVWVYSPKNTQMNLQIIFSKNKDNSWKINRETINQIPLLYEQIHSRKIVSGVQELKSYTMNIKASMPNWSSRQFFFLKIGQWLFILFLIITTYIIKRVASFLSIFLIKKQFIKAPQETLEAIGAPLGVIISLVFLAKALPLIEFSDEGLAFWTKVIYIALSVLFIWFGVGFVKIISLYLNKLALRTQTKVDNILVPLIAKVLNGLVFIIGVILIAHSLNIDVNSLLTGLGIGAMAFAFAAKDTLANFFGSVMIVLDRPFDLGDYISVGSMKGTVEEVGFRSTRLRSSQDSIISIPNGQLANDNIDNFGRRRFRRSDIELGVEYDTSPEELELFCDGLRSIIAQKEWIKNDDSLVYFDSFGDFSLNIKVKFFIMTQGFSTAALHKHQILVEFLELGNKMGIGFAFPTQTLHMKK